MWRIMSSFRRPMRSLALSLRRSSRLLVVLNLAMNSRQSILPSPVMSTRFMIRSMSRELSPKFSFLMEFLNSTSEIHPLPSSSNFLKMSSKVRLEDFIICLSFSMMSASHCAFEELTDTMVVFLSPTGAVFTFVTVELPVYLRASKCARKMYLSIVMNFPFSLITFHSYSISSFENRPPLREPTAFSKSPLLMVFFLESLADLKDRKNWKADSQSVKLHCTVFFNSIKICSLWRKGWKAWIQSCSVKKPFLCGSISANNYCNNGWVMLKLFRQCSFSTNFLNYSKVSLGSPSEASSYEARREEYFQDITRPIC